MQPQPVMYENIRGCKGTEKILFSRFCCFGAYYFNAPYLPLYGIDVSNLSLSQVKKDALELRCYVQC